MVYAYFYTQSVKVFPGEYLGVKWLACDIDDDLIFSKEVGPIYTPISVDSLSCFSMVVDIWVKILPVW